MTWPSRSWCRHARPEPGVTVHVILAPEGPQYETLPIDLRVAFDAELGARRLFESLATSYRAGYVRWIKQAKRPETRARRISRMIDAPRPGKNARLIVLGRRCVVTGRSAAG